MTLKKLLSLLSLLLVLVACGSDPTPTPSVTLAPSPIPWQRSSQVLTLENAPQIRLLGRFDDHAATINLLKFSPDSAYLASASPGDGRLRVWNLASGRAVFAADQFVTRWVYFTPNNETLVALNNRTLQIQAWDFFAQQPLTSLTAQNALISSVVQSDDLRQLAVGGTKGRIYLFDLVPLTSKGYIDAHPIITVEQMAFTPNGQQLISLADGGAMRVWDVATQTMVHEFTKVDFPPERFAISPDGKRLAVAYPNSVRLWSLEDYTLVRTIATPEDAATSTLEFNADGTILIMQGGNQNISLWNALSGQRIVELPEQSRDIAGIELSSDERLLLNGAHGADLYLWNISTLDRANVENNEVQLQRANIAPSGVDVYFATWSANDQWIAFTDKLGLIYVLGISG
ncbi:MAG: WD40 repeat domain-containing protein [Anaerolineales bacterium]|nr:WD40 repeat domain-containing protein [Anaerolineales bacterium]